VTHRVYAQHARACEVWAALLHLYGGPWFVAQEPLFAGDRPWWHGVVDIKGRG
jgi:hypothetical protein